MCCVSIEKAWLCSFSTTLASIRKGKKNPFRLFSEGIFLEKSGENSSQIETTTVVEEQK
jgi:hypothetical protein